jgi:hypothetical protein
MHDVNDKTVLWLGMVEISKIEEYIATKKGEAVRDTRREL